MTVEKKTGKPSPLNSKLWREDWDVEETTCLLSNAWLSLLHSGHMRRQIYRKRVAFSWSVWEDKLKQHLIGSAGSCRGNVLCSKSMDWGDKLTPTDSRLLLSQSLRLVKENESRQNNLQFLIQKFGSNRRS